MGGGSGLRWGGSSIYSAFFYPLTGCCNENEQCLPSFSHLFLPIEQEEEEEETRWMRGAAPERVEGGLFPYTVTPLLRF